jgi:hypothetical protein
MKKILMLILLVVLSLSAQAWTREADQGTRLFAKRYLDASVVKEYTRIMRLGKQYPREKVATPQDERWGRVSLGSDLCSTTTYEGDVVVQLERAADVLRNRANHSDKEQIEALRTIYTNMIIMHNISRVIIEGNEKSKGFTIYRHPGVMAEAEPKYNKSSKSSWSRLWGRDVTLGYYGFTAEMFAEELAICHGADKEQFSAGTIRDWAADMGKEAAAQLEWASPDMKLYRIDASNLESTTCRLMAKAGFRLATLLNEALK